MICRLFFVPLMVLALSSLSFAQEKSGDSGSMISQDGFIPTLGIGANILSSVSGANTTSGVIGFHLSTRGNYFFSPNVGISFGADLTFRGLSSGSTSSSAMFLDIPLAFSFSVPWGMMARSSRPITHVGLFYALPLSDFSGDLSTASLGTKQGYFGFLFSHDTLFPVSPGFSMGFSTWLKYGITSAFTGGAGKFLDFGIGIIFAF